MIIEAIVLRVLYRAFIFGSLLLASLWYPVSTNAASDKVLIGLLLLSGSDVLDQFHVFAKFKIDGQQSWKGLIDVLGSRLQSRGKSLDDDNSDHLSTTDNR